MRLDSKVHGTLIRNKDGREIPEDEFIVFRPHDNAVMPTLECYRQHCIELGASPEQIRAVEALMERVDRWREEHPERCKVADVQPGELVLDELTSSRSVSQQVSELPEVGKPVELARSDGTWHEVPVDYVGFGTRDYGFRHACDVGKTWRCSQAIKSTAPAATLQARDRAMREQAIRVIRLWEELASPELYRETLMASGVWKEHWREFNDHVSALSEMLASKPMELASAQPSASVPVGEDPCNCRYGSCHAASDGDCDWPGCPQTRDGEPAKSG